MNDFILSCCSTADLTEEHFNSRNISYICFHYELNGKEYEDDLGKSVPFDQFYLALQNGASAKTSQVNADEFEHYFESFSERGQRYFACNALIRHFRRYQFRHDCKGDIGRTLPGA